MSGFVPAHVPVLRALGEIWGPDRFIVIGAAAVGYHIGMSWRGTLDLDLSVAAGLDTYGVDLEGLGWRRDAKSPQRWYSPDELIIDVVPAEPDAVRTGSFVWPDGSTMNLRGFRLAFADAIPVAIGPTTNIRVASLRSIVVLKMSAYLDKPWERETDLADLAHIFQAFVGPDANERWSPEVVDLDLDYEEVGLYLLGTQLAAVVDGSESELVHRFLRSVEDDADGCATLGRMARRAPAGWRDPESLRSRVREFGRGFRRSRLADPGGGDVSVRRRYSTCTVTVDGRILPWRPCPIVQGGPVDFQSDGRCAESRATDGASGTWTASSRFRSAGSNAAFNGFETFRFGATCVIVNP